MSIDNAKRLLEEFYAVKLEDGQLAEQIISDNQILQEAKDEFKNDFIESKKKQFIYEYLCKDPMTWPTLKDTDAKLKACRQEKRVVKKRYEEVKERISDILHPLISEYGQLKEQIKQLEEKVHIYENKKELFLSKQKLDPTTVRIAVEKCQKAVDTLQAELGKKKDFQNQLEASIEYLKQNKGGKLLQIEDSVIHRARNILEFMETMSGVKVVESSKDTVTVELIEKCLDNAEGDATDQLSLTLTLHFNIGCHGNIKLIDVKIHCSTDFQTLEFKTADVAEDNFTQVNVDHFNIQDIIDDAILANDVPYLIRNVQNRWLQHYPMLSEMEILNKHHAVDWIQNESRLRVLVGNCGKIMYTLAIPEDYPHSKNITLVNTYGTDEIHLDKLPGKDASLLEWVKHLESLYEEPPN